MAEYALKDLVRIAYHFGMDVRRTVARYSYDPIAISDYTILRYTDSKYPRIIIEPATGVILFKESDFLSSRYKYDSQKHKIIPN